jgi:hypothetical protein
MGSTFSQNRMNSVEALIVKINNQVTKSSKEYPYTVIVKVENGFLITKTVDIISKEKWDYLAETKPTLEDYDVFIKVLTSNEVEYYYYKGMLLKNLIYENEGSISFKINRYEPNRGVLFSGALSKDISFNYNIAYDRMDLSEYKPETSFFHFRGSPNEINELYLNLKSLVEKLIKD